MIRAARLHRLHGRREKAVEHHLVQRIAATPANAAATVAKLITTKNVALWSTGSIDDWANESFTRAKDTAYNFGGEQTFIDDHGGVGEILDATYEARALPVVKLALAKASVRLANLLNAALK